MPWTEHAIFEDEHALAARRLVSTYRFKIGKLEPMVAVRIWERFMAGDVVDRFMFESSHHIHTPVQADAYITSSPYGDTEMAALHRAVHDMTQYYDEAVNQGHLPVDGWLKESPYFER